MRIDKKTKENARKIFDEIGIDMSGAIKLFLKNVINKQGIPLNLLTKNGFTLEQEQRLIAETKKAKLSSKKYKTVNSLMKDLND